MGYTHYFDNVKCSAALADRADSIIRFAEDNGLSICGPLGEGEPIIQDDIIALNGDLSREEDYESFVIREESDYGSGFCKTGQRPYDAVVCAVLISYLALPGNIELSDDELFGSDGSMTDWIESGGVWTYEQAVKPLTIDEASRLLELLNGGFATGYKPQRPSPHALTSCSDAVKLAVESAYF